MCFALGSHKRAQQVAPGLRPQKRWEETAARHTDSPPQTERNARCLCPSRGPVWQIDQPNHRQCRVVFEPGEIDIVRVRVEPRVALPLRVAVPFVRFFSANSCCFLKRLFQACVCACAYARARACGVEGD
jgi:hypothetical protein